MVIKILRSRDLSSRYAKYLSVGVGSFIVDYSTFALSFYVFNFTLILSILIGMISGLIFGFILNKVWAFSAKKVGNTKFQAAQFVALFLFNTLFSYILISTLQKYAISEFLGKFISMLFIMVWNYFIYKKLIFRS